MRSFITNLSALATAKNLTQKRFFKYSENALKFQWKLDDVTWGFANWKSQCISSDTDKNYRQLMAEDKKFRVETDVGRNHSDHQIFQDM